MGDITARVWYSGQYYCQCGTVGDITASVVQWAILLPVWYSGQYYCHSVVQWAILLPECGTVGDIAVKVRYNGRYYCHSVVNWAILLPECGTVGDITARVHLASERTLCWSAEQDTVDIWQTNVTSCSDQYSAVHLA